MKAPPLLLTHPWDPGNVEPMIGVFDSGYGGLTVLKAFLEKLPEYDYLYLGDSARAPYGNKSLKVVYEYTRQAVEFLFRQGAVLIVLACNTASVKALRKIQQEWLPVHQPDRRVLGVVIPLAEAAVEASRRGRIGVIGTRATVESRVFEQELHKLNPGPDSLRAGLSPAGSPGGGGMGGEA